MFIFQLKFTNFFNFRMQMQKGWKAILTTNIKSLVSIHE